MENKKQKEAFLEYEANAWFERNKPVILNYSKDRDRVISLIVEYKLNPSSVLEIGCSAGYRLNAINSIYNDCRVYGIEPSEKAIEFGKKTFPEVQFHKGTADDLSIYENDSMDIVIVGFVFYVIDRKTLFKVVSEIDRVLKDGGILVIIDFFSETALKNTYEHIKEFSAFSFKQNYDEIFTASKLYYLLDKSTWNHSTKTLEATSDYKNKYSVSLLKKDIDATYK